MMKKVIIICLIILVIVVTIFTVILISKNSETTENAEGIAVKVYKEGTDKLKRTVNVTDEERINEIKDIANKIKEMYLGTINSGGVSGEVGLAIPIETVIVINENETILINLRSEPNYCTYINKDLNISATILKPEGLTEWLDKVL